MSQTRSAGRRSPSVSSGVHPSEGKVVRLHHPDGTPPYDVEWSDTGRIAVVFPGPDARVEHFGDGLTLCGRRWGIGGR